METKLHPKPYPFRWVCDNPQLQATKQCILRFAITFGFVDEVDLDVASSDICGIVLGSPYMYDRKAFFYREDNKYKLTYKDVLCPYQTAFKKHYFIKQNCVLFDEMFEFHIA